MPSLVLVHTFGLTIQSVIEYVITLPPTQTHSSKTVVVKANNEYSDLYFALRGGSANNFGIVSSIKYSILVVPPIIEYNINYTWTNDSIVTLLLDAWQANVITRPINYNEAIGAFMQTNARTKGIAITGYYVTPANQTFAEASIAITAEVASLVEPFGGTLVIHPTVSYSALYKKLVANRIYRNFSLIQASFVQTSVSSANIVAQINSALTINSNVFIGLDLLLGQVQTLPATATAFAFTQYNFFLDVSANCEESSDEQAMSAWMFDTVTALGYTNYYVGFPIFFQSIADSVPANIYNGINYPTLQTIKTKYEPANVLSRYGTIA